VLDASFRRSIADGILPDLPINLITNELYNKVPYISGVNENEGIYFWEGVIGIGDVFDRDYVTNNLDELVFNYTFLTGDKLDQVTSLISEFYFSNIDLDNNTAINEAVQYVIGDIIFNTAHYLIMSALPKGDDYPAVYSYAFTYVGEPLQFPSTGQVTHADELPYLFDEYGILNAQDNVTSEIMLTLWTTFAKTGNPNPANSDVITTTWEAVNSTDSVSYLNIGTELSMLDSFNYDRIQFWINSIIPIVLPEYSKH
jgi:carboxylesterase type B